MSLSEKSSLEQEVGPTNETLENPNQEENHEAKQDQQSSLKDVDADQNQTEQSNNEPNEISEQEGKQETEENPEPPLEKQPDENTEKQEEPIPENNNVQEIPKPIEEKKDPIPVEVQSPPVRKLTDQSSVEHPLNLVERKERDITAKIGDEIDLEEKFHVTRNKQTDVTEKAPKIVPSNVEIITRNCFSDENGKLPMHGNEDWGQPKALAVLANKYIAIGTAKGLILIFNHMLTRIQKFGSTKEREFGAVTAMDIAPKEEDVIAVYENGKIILWSMAKNEKMKVIDSPEKGPVLNVKFYKDITENFLLSTSSGNVYQYRAEQIFFQWKIDKKLLPVKSEEKDPNPKLPSGFFGIQLLNKSQTVKGASIAKYFIVAFVSMKEIVIAMMEPAFTVLFRTKRPANLRDLVTPCISWGRGALPNEEANPQPILAYSWGKEISLIQLKNFEVKKNININLNKDLNKVLTKDVIKDEEFEKAEKVKLSGLLIAKEDVAYMQWISPSHILISNSFGEISCITSKKFKPIALQGTKEFDYSQAVLSTVPLDDEIKYQMFNDSMMAGIPQNSVIFYEHTVKGTEFTKSVYMVGKKTMLLLKHISWQEYLDDLCKKLDWLTAMSVCASLYQNKTETFADIPSNEEEKKSLLQVYAIKITQDFILALEDQNRTEPISLKSWQKTVDTVIDLLVSTENFKYLFSQIPQALEIFNIKQLFLDSIEPFILKGRITTLTNDAFKEMVQFFSEKKKLDTLQYLIINLSMKNIDMEYAIILCMQHNLLTALMYLCAHKNDPEGPDVTTPIASALGQYQKSVREGKPNQENGLKFLWFVNMVFNARLFPDRELSHEHWELKVKDILILLFDEANIDLILQIDENIAFELLETLFQPKFNLLLSSYDDSVVKLIGDWPQEKGMQPKRDNPDLWNTINLFIASTQSKLYGQILGHIYYCGKKNEAYYNRLYYFLANIHTYLEFKLPWNITNEAVFYLIEHAFVPPAWSPLAPQARSPERKENVLNKERSRLIVGLLKELEQFITPMDLDIIEEKVEKLGLIDVTGFVYTMKKEYEKGFDFYIGQSSASQKERIFKWLREVVRRVIPPEDEDETEEAEAEMEEIMEKFQKFKELLTSKLYHLVAISSEETRKIILSLEDSEFELEIVKHLNKQPELQLEYLNQIISTRDEYDPLPNDILILHMDLLCQLSPKQVISELKVHNYPLDACEELLKKYNIQNGLALLYERSGRIKDALDIYLDVFEECLDKRLTKIEKESIFGGPRSLTHKFESICHTCSEYIKADDESGEETWFSVLDALLGFYERIVDEEAEAADIETNEAKQKCYKEIKRAFINYIGTFIEEMSTHVEIKEIIKTIQRCKAIRLAEMKDAFISMLLGHYREMVFLRKAELIVSEDTDAKMNFLYQKRFSGSRVHVEKTKERPREFRDEDLMVFYCKHNFPRGSVEGESCLLCAGNEVSKIENLIIECSTKGLRILKNRITTTQTSKDKKADKNKSGSSSKKEEKKPVDLRLSKTKTECIQNLDRFEEWRHTDEFNWSEKGEDKTKVRNPFGDV